MRLIELVTIMSIIFIMISYIVAFIGILFNKKVDKAKVLLFFFFVFVLYLIVSIVSKPHELDDLSRYYTLIDNFRNDGISYYASFPYKTNIITLLIFYLVSLTPYNQILPIITVFLFYGGILIIFKKILPEKIESRTVGIFYFCFFSIMYFKTIYSGIRFSLALMTFLVILVYEKNKRNSYFCLLYLLPFFIHSSALIFILIRYLFPLFEKIKIKKYVIILIGWGCSLLMYIIFAYSNLYIYFGGFGYKLKAYVVENFIFSRYIDIRLYICLIVVFILLTICFIVNNRKKGLYNNYVKWLIMFLTTVVFFPVIFERINQLFTLMIMPYLICLNDKKKYESFLLYSIFFFSMGIMAYRIVHLINYWCFVF